VRIGWAIIATWPTCFDFTCTRRPNRVRATVSG